MLTFPFILHQKTCHHHTTNETLNPLYSTCTIQLLISSPVRYLSHVYSATNPLHQVPSLNPTYSQYLSSASFWLWSASFPIGVMGKSLARPENSLINSIPVQQYLPCTVIFKTCQVSPSTINSPPPDSSSVSTLEHANGMSPTCLHFFSSRWRP